MVQTIVTPQKEDFEMRVALPAEYIGKTVHVLFYADDEPMPKLPPTAQRTKPSDYLGILNNEKGKAFDIHINKMRTEWGRDI